MRALGHTIGVGAAIALVAGALPAPLWSGASQDKSPTGGDATPVLNYINVKGCSSCHKSKATGNQIEMWKATAHARAWKTLGTEAAREVAKKAGVDGDPQAAPRCLLCHTTAASLPKLVPEARTCTKCHNAESPTSRLSTASTTCAT